VKSIVCYNKLLIWADWTSCPRRISGRGLEKAVCLLCVGPVHGLLEFAVRDGAGDVHASDPEAPRGLAHGLSQAPRAGQ